MKAGDMIRFKATGATALILQVYKDGHSNLNDYVDLYIGDGTLDGTPASSGFTSMSVAMAERTAEVINDESR
jgi:hypothetical protein